MLSRLTNSQIKKLGERLRHGVRTIDDVKLLEIFRRSYRSAYDQVIQLIHENYDHKVTGRPAKSSNSIIEKLEREKSRLTTIQDIAGCRIILKDCLEQENLIRSFSKHFSDFKIVDRRINPSYGYRAVHFIAYIERKPVEIQIRTLHQHLWAELSERLSDIFHQIKYGGGPPKIREILDNYSSQIEMTEKLEIKYLSIISKKIDKLDPGIEKLITSIEEQRVKLNNDIEDQLNELINTLNESSEI